MAKLDPEWLEVLKTKIRDSEIIDKHLKMCDRVKDHVEGTKSMSKSELEGAKVFAMLSKPMVNKLVPDVKAVEVTGANGGPVQVAVTRIELVDLDGNGSGKAPP